MRTEEERQELVGLIDVYKRAKFRKVTEILSGTEIGVHTWHKAAAGHSISDDKFYKILDLIYRSRVDGITSRKEFGSYSISSMEEYEGYYSIYRPNSEDKAKIEVFSAKCAWSGKDRCLMVYVQNIRSQSEYFVHKPKTHNNISLRGVSIGWSSLYILGKHVSYGGDHSSSTCISGVSVAMDTIVPGEQLFHPILFPVVFEKVNAETLHSYYQLEKGSHAYERADALLKAAVDANISVIETVWSRFTMPGNSNGGPDTSPVQTS
ncbi:hypothetical protein RJJ37_29595 [Rhizobium redzepovicii]|uniref:Uncharacterized protein n=1 Tax=Rhizobium redzepovicii TaxID=2867518 RepID=A0AAW8P9M5_9HYPH|nr:hypothetical protein [Rhizobium redzepovicii]MDR9763736.1 hypothetical protein [Rhizobium redzepovicii]